MYEVIRRSDAIKAIMNKPAWHGSEGSWFHSDDIKDAINSIPAVEPCEDAVSRQAVIDMLDGLSVDAERGFEFGTEEETFIGKFEAITNVSDLPSVTAETDIDDYMKGYDHGAADTWKIAQTVFGSTVTLYEAMDVARCMKGVEDETY